MKIKSLFTCGIILGAAILFPMNVKGAGNDNEPVVIEGSSYLEDPENNLLYVTCPDYREDSLTLSVYDITKSLQNPIKNIAVLPYGLRQNSEVKLGLVQDVYGKIRKDHVMVYIAYFEPRVNYAFDFLGLLVNTNNSQVKRVYEEDGKHWIPYYMQGNQEPWGKVIRGHLYIRVFEMPQVGFSIGAPQSVSFTPGRDSIWIQYLPIDYGTQVPNAPDVPGSMKGLGNAAPPPPVATPAKKPTPAGGTVPSNLNPPKLQ